MRSPIQPMPRGHIGLLAPYQLADISPQGDEVPILLSQNEHGLPPDRAVLRAALTAAHAINRYPKVMP